MGKVRRGTPGGFVAICLLLFSWTLSAQQTDSAQSEGPPATVDVQAQPDDPVSAPVPEPSPPTPLPPKIDVEQLPVITPGPAMTLEQALITADQRNLGLNAARMEIEKSQAQLSQAWALILPGVQGSVQFMHNDHEDSFDIMGNSTVVRFQEDLKGTLQAGMPLIHAQNWYTISAAKKGIELARISVEQGRQQLLIGVAQAYYFALMATSLIELRETQLKATVHHLRVAKARYDAGTGLRIDVIRAETDLEQARQELLAGHLSLDNARDTLGNLTKTDGLPMPVETAPIQMPGGSDEQLIDRAKTDRRDIKVKKSTVALMKTQLDGAWMQFIPTLEAGWQLNYQFTKPSAMGSQDRSRWALVFTLNIPIYNHFRYGDLDHKRASLRQARMQQEEAEHNASLAVRKARRDFLTALSSVEIAENQCRLAKEALVLTEASYTAGTGSSLDVTDARRTASSADLNLMRLRLEAQIALLTLLDTIGEDMVNISK